MPCIQQLNKDIGEDAAFRFVFEGTEFLKNLTEGLDPKECECNYNMCYQHRSWHPKIEIKLFSIFNKNSLEI